jgi:hypothetical protein
MFTYELYIKPTLRALDPRQKRNYPLLLTVGFLLIIRIYQNLNNPIEIILLTIGAILTYCGLSLMFIAIKNLAKGDK